MNRSTLFVVLLLLCSLSKAQVLQPMGPALPGKVVASFASGNDYLALFDEIATTEQNDFTLARWNGVYWKYYPGLTTPPPVTTTNGTYNFHSVALYRDTIYAAAYIADAQRDAEVPISHLYKWNGVKWVPEIGVVDTRNNGIIAMTVFDDKLIVAGLFSNTVDGNPVQNIAAYNGSKWSYLGNNSSEQGTDGVIKSLAVAGNRLYIAGDFNKFCGTTTGNIAYYTAANGGWGGIGSPFNGEILELTSYDGKLAALGLNNSIKSINIFQGTWGDALQVDTFSIFNPVTIAGAGKNLLIGGTFVKNGAGTTLLTYDGVAFGLTGNRIVGSFSLGQRGNQPFIWGNFTESNTGIRNFSRIEVEAGNLYGDVYYDLNTNCLKDDNEIGLRGVMVRLMNKVTGVSYFTVTDSSGRFSNALPTGDYNIYLMPGKHLGSTCVANSSARIRAGVYSSISMGYYQYPSIVDVSVKSFSIIPNSVKAGSEMKVIVLVKNHGALPLSAGTIQLIHPARLTGFTSNPPADNYNGTEATYALNGLPAFSEKTYEVALSLPTDAAEDELFDVQLKTGSLLTATDQDLSDNSDTLALGLSRRSGSGAVVKTSNDGARIDYQRKKWKYRVDFTNVSADFVKRTVMIDTIDVKLPLQRINVTGFYPAQTKLSMQQGRILVVDFPTANLSAYEANPSQAVGFVEYEVELINQLSVGTQVKNVAYVDFDSKWMDHSANCMVKLDDLTATEKFNKQSHFGISPNPSKGVFQIVGKDAYAQSLIQHTQDLGWVAYDLLGREVAKGSLQSQKIDLSHLNNGFYTVKIGAESSMIQVLK